MEGKTKRNQSIMAISPLIEAVLANNQYEEEFDDDGDSLDDVYVRPIGLTALIHACKGGYLNIAELLLSKGAVVYRRDIKERYTALMMASHHNHVGIVRLLISEGVGADVDLKDDDGFTAFHIASYIGYLRMVQLLLCQGADMSIRDIDWGYCSRLGIVSRSLESR